MCRRRKDPVVTTSYYDYFLEKSPPKTSFKFIIGFIAISIILLGISLIPQVVMFKTEFTSSDVQIMDFTGDPANGSFDIGVTQILWGTWKACYNTETTSTCTGTDWISNPYNFIINKGILNVTVQGWWLHVLFLQFIGVFLAILIGLIVIFRYCCLGRNKSRIDATGKNVNSKNGRICNLTSILAAFLFVWITIVVVGNSIVLGKIDTEIKSLGTGTSTKAAPGFWLPVVADAFTFLSFILIASYIRSKYNKYRQTTQTSTELMQG